jgi:hypothetical protein
MFLQHLKALAAAARGAHRDGSTPGANARTAAAAGGIAR